MHSKAKSRLCPQKGICLQSLRKGAPQKDTPNCAIIYAVQVLVVCPWQPSGSRIFGNICKYVYRLWFQQWCFWSWLLVRSRSQRLMASRSLYNRCQSHSLQQLFLRPAAQWSLRSPGPSSLQVPVFLELWQRRSGDGKNQRVMFCVAGGWDKQHLSTTTTGTRLSSFRCFAFCCLRSAHTHTPTALA